MRICSGERRSPLKEAVLARQAALIREGVARDDSRSADSEAPVCSVVRSEKPLVAPTVQALRAGHRLALVE